MNIGRLFLNRLSAVARVVAVLPVLLLLLPAAEAAQITSVSLQKSAQGDVLRIKSDAPLDYQSFDLNAPPRLVLQFPKSTVKKGIAVIRSKKSGVKSVAVSSAKSGVRLEIGLSKALRYKVKQYKDGLILQFAATSSDKAAVVKNAAVLKDITIRDRGDTTELVIRGEHMDASHGAFMSNKGRNLILDFWGATSRLPKEHYAAATQKISDVMIGADKKRVRLVVKLLPGISDKHQIDASKGQLVVRFGSVTPRRKAAQVRVEDVLFKPNDRIAQLVIRTNVSNPIVSLHEDAKKGTAIIDIRKAALAKGQQRSQDVSDFSGPLKQVDAYKLGDKVRIVARLRDKVEISSFQQGNVLTVTFVPKDIAAAKRGSSASEAFTYSGEKIDLNLQGIDIKNVLRLIADKSNMNFIMGDGVQGKLNMHLEQVPWDQALDIILATQGLGKEQQGNVMRIAPVEVLTKERVSKLAARKSEAQLAPLITEFITLSFAKATEVKAMLDQSVKNDQKTNTTKGGQASKLSTKGNISSKRQNRILSKRGSFVVDDRTNTLIVKDTQDSINNMKRLIAKIDQPAKQVLIEARIIEATDQFSRELGVRWGGQVSGRGGRVTNQVTNSTGTPGGFLVDLPSTAAVTGGGQLGLAIGALSNAFNLKLELSAAEADGKIKLISSPRILASNHTEALIEQIERIPFPVTTFTGGVATTSTKSEEAKLTLKITPDVTADGRLTLVLEVNKDTPRVNDLIVGGDPIITTKKLTSTLLVSNGETVVLGGIYTQEKSKNDVGVPGLSRIPILGWLFKKRINTIKRTELLVFITPTIVKTMPSVVAEAASDL